jgi:hypothetical protein
MSLEYMSDLEVSGPKINGGCFAARKYCRAFTGLMPQGETHAVANVEMLGLDPAVVEHDMAIGHDAIHVSDQ